MTKLSPAAQAVWNAYNDVCERVGVFEDYGDALAAAFRAAANQVVPEVKEPPCGEREPWPQGYQLVRDAQWEKCQQLRSEILAIAAELDGTQLTRGGD